MRSSLHVEIHTPLKEFDLNVSFSMRKGILGILGASGSGKSMTLKSIAGIQKIHEGIIEYDTRTLFDSKSRINLSPQKRRVGYLFQNYALFPNMNVEENIASGLKKGDSKGIVSQMIEKFSLQGLEKRYPKQLSGGQQQRVALARILAYNPDVILLDEPFSALDTFLKERLRMELSKVLSEYDGYTIIVTHDREEAFQLCDQILIMDQGKVLTFGDTYEIFENPKKVKVASLTGCKNISRIKRINEHKVSCLDWNIELEMEQKVSDNITHIGIRAHDFIPCAKEDKNSIFIENPKLQELPFEWEVLLENGLWWKIHKEIHNHEMHVPEYIQVDSKNILLLEE